MLEYRANTVKAETANTVLTMATGHGSVTHRGWNNTSTSVRRPTGAKMYAELRRTKKSKNLGIKSLRDNNLIPVISDSHCPASHLFFLNEKYLSLWVHKDEDMRMEPFQKPVSLLAEA